MRNAWARGLLCLSHIICWLLLTGSRADAIVDCEYEGTGCNEGYSATATFECLSSSLLKIVVANTSTIDARDPGNNVLSSLTFDGARPQPSLSDSATVASGSTLLPIGQVDCRSSRNGRDVTCEWSAGSEYCANGPDCDGVDRSCRSPVPQCGLSFISARQSSDTDCSRRNFVLAGESIDSSDNGTDFGVISPTQSQPEGGFERINDTVELVVDVGACRETPLFCDGVATYGPHFRHAPGVLATTNILPPSRSTAFSFLLSLSGENQVPPNASAATGTGTATLNTDDTITYSISSSEFDTDFADATVRAGRPGQVGPALFGLRCDSGGATCSGTTRRLTAIEVTALLSGDTYVTMRTAGFPGGEIRGQFAPTAPIGSFSAVRLKKFEGGAKPVGSTSPGQPRRAEIRIKGRFEVADRLELNASTVIINSLLNETEGAGELVRGASGELALPIPLRLARHDGRGEAVYRTVQGSIHPTCRLGIKPRGRSAFEFDLRCRRTDGASVPVVPRLCSGGARRPTTDLTTDLLINAASPIAMTVTQPWRCLRNQGTIYELKSIRGALDSDDFPRFSTNKPPRADFRADPQRGNAPLIVRFDNRSSDADGGVIDFSWDFGDGRQGIAQHPVHTFEKAGEYIVRLIVTDDEGAQSDEARASISVKANKPPLADFRASVRKGEAPLTVSFQDRSSDPDGDIVAYGWNFGNGRGSVDKSPTHTYVQPGEFVASLLVRDDQGSTSEIRTEIITVQAPRQQAAPRPQPTSPGSPAPPSTQNDVPRADFRLDRKTGVAPLDITFMNRSSDSDGEVVSYEWDFGDGIRSAEENPIHTYERAGVFDVILVVMDEQGSTSHQKREIVTVKANKEPQADFRADPRRGDAPLAVSFTDRSGDSDGEIVQYSWSFGDGQASNEREPTHVYTAPGRYEVLLTVTDERGAASEPPRRETIEVR